MLCLQGDYFKKKCSRYLEEDHKITEEEYLHLCSEHDVYKMLGGKKKKESRANPPAGHQNSSGRHTHGQKATA